MFQMVLALALLYITDMQWQKSYDYETVYKTNKFVADFIWCKINSELMYDFSIKKQVNLPKIAKKCASFLNTYQQNVLQKPWGVTHSLSRLPLRRPINTKEHSDFVKNGSLLSWFKPPDTIFRESTPSTKRLPPKKWEQSFQTASKLNIPSTYSKHSPFLLPATMNCCSKMV